MQYIDLYRGYDVTRHATDVRERVRLGDTWLWQARTSCGRTLYSRYSGECIAPMIDCGSCRRSLRREGWSV